MERDIRDPKELGENLLTMRNSKFFKDFPLTEIMDDYAVEARDYSGEMTGFYTAQEYRKELEEREDKYAKSTLERIALATEQSSERINNAS